MLSFDAMAVTVAEADAYCVGRGLSAWTGDNATKTAALRRGQDYIAGVYNTRWTVAFDDATAPNVVKFAITEAAVREIKVPGSLTPDITLGREKVLTEVKGIKWTPLKADAKLNDLTPVLTTIRNLLRGVAAVDAVPGALVV